MVEDAKGKVRRFQDYTFVHQAMTNKIKFDGLLGPPPALIGLNEFYLVKILSAKNSEKMQRPPLWSTSRSQLCCLLELDLVRSLPRVPRELVSHQSCQDTCPSGKCPSFLIITQ